MPSKAISVRLTSKIALKPVHITAATPRPKAQRVSKLEARRLASFKALMKKFGGKLSFAGCDE